MESRRNRLSEGSVERVGRHAGTWRPSWLVAALLVAFGLFAPTPLAQAAQGTITTVAGGGAGGDGIPATQSRLREPRRIALLPGGGFLVVEFGSETDATYGDGRVRRVGADGTISTVAGNGLQGFSGDGGPAVAAQMNGPTDVILTGDNGYLIADEFNHRVRRVSADDTIATVAGAGGEGCGPQSGPAIDARFTWVRALAMESGGESYLLLDENCSLVHRVSAGADDAIGTVDDTIATVAGSGGPGFSGDGGQARSATLHDPRGIAAVPGGAFLIADSLNHRIRRVGVNGVIRTVAGTGENAFGLDGGYADDTPLATPRDVEATPDGGFLIAESGTNRARWVAPNGVITTIAGTGTHGISGDGGPATSARLAVPFGVNISPQGDVYVSGPGLADGAATNYRVRRVQGPLPAAPPLPTPGTPTEPPPTQPAPPVAPPTVEAPPTSTPLPGRGPTSGSVVATPAAISPAPLGLRLSVRGPHRVVAGARVLLRLRATAPIAGRAIAVQRARRTLVHGRPVLRYRSVAVRRPAGRVADVAVRVPTAGVHRLRLVWTDLGRLRRSGPVTIVARPASLARRAVHAWATHLSASPAWTPEPPAAGPLAPASAPGPALRAPYTRGDRGPPSTTPEGTR